MGGGQGEIYPGEQLAEVLNAAKLQWSSAVFHWNGNIIIEIIPLYIYTPYTRNLKSL